MRRDRGLIPLLAALVLVSCGGDGEPIADPAEVIVGHWVFSNAVGESSYTFSSDGTFRSKVANRFQSFSVRGSYRIDGERVRLDYDDANHESQQLRLLDRDRLVEVGGKDGVVYRRRE